jgi:hypothetical protein
MLDIYNFPKDFGMMITSVGSTTMALFVAFGHLAKNGMDYNTFTYIWTSSVCEFNGSII